MVLKGDNDDDPRRRHRKWPVSRAAIILSAVAVAGLTAWETRPVVGRSMVISQYGIVATSQPLAARVGIQILERGGNAVDAAIATSAAMSLMEPTGNGLGSDLFAIISEPGGGGLHGLNASGWAPAGLTAEVLRREGLEVMPQRGIHSVTVPGIVAGWEAMRRRFGRLPFDETLAPAIFYAEHGFPITETVAHWWQRAEKGLSAHPSAARTFLPGGRAPRTGELFRNPDLAGTLRRIVADGRDGYYRGHTADAILALMRETGGTMTADDLTEFTPEWVTPMETTYRGWRVAQLPPNGQGIAALLMLNLMERFPLDRYGFQSPEALHVMIEAKKLAYADMIAHVGDPRFTAIPVEGLLSKTHAAARAQRIDPHAARCDVEPSELDRITDARGHDTIYLTVVDQHGGVVSLIQSNYSGFGSGLVPSGTGFMLQNRGALFTLEPDHPNTLAPRKRPLHTIIPGFMEKEGTRIGFGIIGGWNQAQAHAQFVSSVADHGLNIQQALEAGRFTKVTFTGCDVQLEVLVPDATRALLEALGHEIEVVAPRSGTFGWGQAVMSDADGMHFGASEPRHDGAAIPQAPPVFKDVRGPLPRVPGVVSR
ncbi:gamma-glutamyltransferase [soil metagenome]